MQIYPFFIAQAGCPQRCVYCRQEASVGREAAPAPDAVARSLDGMLPAAGEGEVAFYGGSFTLLPGALQEAYFAAVAPFLRTGRIGGIRISTRPDGLGDATVRSLLSAGVTTVEIGCQSFSAEVLRRSRRGHGVQEAAAGLARLRRSGMRIGLQLMPGLPSGDRSEALASLRTALGLRPDFLRIYPAVVLRGTELETLWRRGRYRPLELDEAVEICADLLRECRSAGIPVIRLGLQATAGLDRGDGLAAGPYHPAFGQLVRSRLWRRALLRVADRCGAWTVGLHPADIADAVGHRRSNFDYLARHCGPPALTPDPDLPRETLQRDGERFTLLELSGGEEFDH